MNLLLVESNRHSDALMLALQEAATHVQKTSYAQSLPTLIKEAEPDIIFFNIAMLTDTMVQDLQWLNQHFPLPVIVFIAEADQQAIQQLMELDVSVLRVNCLVYADLPNLLQIALARFKQQQLLKNALEEAKAQLEDRKQIDRAKAILIKTQHYTEHEAYHTLRKLAMDRNSTLSEMAKNVIAMAELLK